MIRCFSLHLAIVLCACTFATAADLLVADQDELNQAIKWRQARRCDRSERRHLDRRRDQVLRQGQESKPITLARESRQSDSLRRIATQRRRKLARRRRAEFQGRRSRQRQRDPFRDGDDKGASNCRLTNCSIVDYNPSEPPKGNTQWVSLYGQHNRVDHCYFKGKNTSGPIFVVWVEDQPNDHMADHNYFAGRPALRQRRGDDAHRHEPKSR